MTRRPGSYRIETALCERVSTLRFALPDKQRTADGCCGKANNEGNYAARCTPVSEILRGCGVTHIDFWSLECALPPPPPPHHSLREPCPLYARMLVLLRAVLKVVNWKF